MHAGCRSDGVAVNSISYADDMVLLSQSIGALRNFGQNSAYCSHTSRCVSNMPSLGLKYSVNKSEFMCFGLGDKPLQELPPIYLNGSLLTRVKQFKDLGHIVTDELKENEDIERERRTLAVWGNMLARRFARCSVAVSAFQSLL